MSQEVQGLARDVFYYLKETLGLNYGCKCEVCLDKGRTTPSVFSPAMGDNVLILSLVCRRFFRAGIKSMALRYLNAVLQPEQEMSMWEEVSFLARYLMDTRQRNCIVYVFGLISETYLYRYARLRRQCESNPCVVYLKAAISCFAYVYDVVLRDKYDDFRTTLEEFKMERGDYKKCLVYKDKMYEYFLQRPSLIKSSTTVNPEKSWKYRSVNNEELHQEFGLAFELIDPITEKEEVNMDNIIQDRCKFYEENTLRGVLRGIPNPPIDASNENAIATDNSTLQDNEDITRFLFSDFTSSDVQSDSFDELLVDIAKSIKSKETGAVKIPDLLEVKSSSDTPVENEEYNYPFFRRNFAKKLAALLEQDSSLIPDGSQVVRNPEIPSSSARGSSMIDRLETRERFPIFEKRIIETFNSNQVQFSLCEMKRLFETFSTNFSEENLRTIRCFFDNSVESFLADPAKFFANQYLPAYPSATSLKDNNDSLNKDLPKSPGKDGSDSPQMAVPMSPLEDVHKSPQSDFSQSPLPDAHDSLQMDISKSSLEDECKSLKTDFPQSPLQDSHDSPQMSPMEDEYESPPTVIHQTPLQDAYDSLQMDILESSLEDKCRFTDHPLHSLTEGSDSSSTGSPASLTDDKTNQADTPEDSDGESDSSVLPRSSPEVPRKKYSIMDPLKNRARLKKESVSTPMVPISSLTDHSGVTQTDSTTEDSDSTETDLPISYETHGSESTQEDTTKGGSDSSQESDPNKADKYSIMYPLKARARSSLKQGSASTSTVPISVTDFYFTHASDMTLSDMSDSPLTDLPVCSAENSEATQWSLKVSFLMDTIENLWEVTYGNLKNETPVEMPMKKDILFLKRSLRESRTGIMSLKSSEDKIMCNLFPVRTKNGNLVALFTEKNCIQTEESKNLPSETFKNTCVFTKILKKIYRTEGCSSFPKFDLPRTIFALLPEITSTTQVFIAYKYLQPDPVEPVPADPVPVDPMDPLLRWILHGPH